MLLEQLEKTKLLRIGRVYFAQSDQTPHTVVPIYFEHLGGIIYNLSQLCRIFNVGGDEA